MPKEYQRTDRVADYLKRELARLIQYEINDPRLGMININDVDVSRDLSHAKIYFTVIGAALDVTTSDANGKKTAEILNKAGGFLRKQIASSNTMRTTPQLHFFYDRSVIAGGQLASLIDKAVASDKEHHSDD